MKRLINQEEIDWTKSIMQDNEIDSGQNYFAWDITDNSYNFSSESFYVTTNDSLYLAGDSVFLEGNGLKIIANEVILSERDNTSYGWIRRHNGGEFGDSIEIVGPSNDQQIEHSIQIGESGFTVDVCEDGQYINLLQVDNTLGVVFPVGIRCWRHSIMLEGKIGSVPICISFAKDSINYDKAITNISEVTGNLMYGHGASCPASGSYATNNPVVYIEETNSYPKIYYYSNGIRNAINWNDVTWSSIIDNVIQWCK